MINLYICKEYLGSTFSVVLCPWCGEIHIDMEIVRFCPVVDILLRKDPVQFAECDNAVICPNTDKKIYLSFGDQYQEKIDDFYEE